MASSPQSSREAPRKVTQGLSRKSGIDNPNPIQHGGMGQAERAFSAASTFLSGVMAISASQLIGAPLKLIDKKFYESYMAWTKESFAILMTTITQWWAPTVIRVGGDESMKGQLFLMDDGTLKCNFPHRLILMGNHQLYTDWLYLWWIAYTNKMHGRIYIILKESLKQLPIIGWGMQFYNFIFLSRKWEHDRLRFQQQLDHLKDPDDPMWLLIFPEGTNLSATTREKSAAWAKKIGVSDMKHQLLPRSTGLQFCLKELRQSTNWLYDCTIAYEGVPKGLYGQDVYTLKSSFIEGRPPKSVNMFWRRFRIADIPCDNDKAFGRWLLNRWREKDYMLEYYHKFGNFPDLSPTEALRAVRGQRKPEHAKAITTYLKGGGWDEFLGIFGPITTAAGALGSIDLTEPLNIDELMKNIAETQQLSLANLGKSELGAASQRIANKALLEANKRNPLPQALLDQLLKAMPQAQQQATKSLPVSKKVPAPKKTARPPAAVGSTLTSIGRPARQAARRADSAPPATLNSIGKTNVNTPAQVIKQQMPLANMESMVTRPLSTIAVQKAGTTLKNIAMSNTQTKIEALPKGNPTSKMPRRGSTVSAGAVGNAASRPLLGSHPRLPKAPASTR